MMKKLNLVLLLLIASKSYGQIDSTLKDGFERLRYSPEYSNLEFNSSKMSFDTLKVDVKYNSKLIITENYFTNSKRAITIKYYFKNNSLYFITTSEICPTKPNLTCNSGYYITNDTINQKEHSSSRKISLGVVLTMKEIQEHHFCPERFEYDFLEEYIWILLRKLKAEL